MTDDIRNLPYEELINLPTLGLDDTFPFRCKSCGKCCKHREDVLLTPYDVFRLARYLERTPEEIIKGYCEVYEGRESHMLIVRVKPLPPENSCPFLRNKKCAVHKAKPVLCRVYPLARFNSLTGSPRYYYGSEGPPCGHGKGSVTVRDWIADVASDESERAGMVWTIVMQRILPAVHEEKKVRTVDEYDEIINMLFKAFYLIYDINQDFASQCQRNVEALCELLLSRFGIKTPTYEEIKEMMEKNI